MSNEPTKPPVATPAPAAATASHYLNRKTPGVYITDGAIASPTQGVALTERVISDCEMGGFDLIDSLVDDIVGAQGAIKDSKGADITEKVRGQLGRAWSEAFKYTFNNQRSNIRTRQAPELCVAADSDELIARLRDSKDTMSGMMSRQGIQLDSWSPARKTLHTEVMNRYSGMIEQLIQHVWKNRVAPAPSLEQGGRE